MRTYILGVHNWKNILSIFIHADKLSDLNENGKKMV